MTGTFYRVGQLTRGLRPNISATDIAYVQNMLNASQATLFFKLPLFEQRHALNVCQTLVQGGFGNDVELLQAALLHDLGKADPDCGRYIPLWGKAANVILQKLGGRGLVAKIASREPQSWRYIFYLQCRHEKRSARLARAAGSGKRVVALVGNCQTLLRKQDPTALALKWADDLN